MMVECTLALPADFRIADALQFHRRDGAELAERVRLDDSGEHGYLQKAFMRDGQALVLEVELAAPRLQARLQAEGEAQGHLPALDETVAEQLLGHMFGLQQPVAAFEAAHRDHPELGPLLQRNAGLRVVQVATPFEALSWAILGQQISLAAAIALRRKLIAALGEPHSLGLRCYPAAAALAAAEVDALRALGCSRSKAQALVTTARAASSGALPLDDWLQALAGASGAAAEALVAEISTALLSLHGVGPWTLNYTLLRGFGWLDGGLEGDVAVRRGLQRLRGLEQAPGERETRAWLAPFRPWRALVAAHLWTLSTAGTA